LVAFATFAVSAFLVVTACGKKGPPMPPLVRLPAAPPDLVAERRGNTVDLKFTVPSTNTDGTRPANVSRAEVYAITLPASTAPPLTDDQIVKLGTRVATVPVKAPRDPNLTADPEEPADEVDAPEGPGLDQGATARVAELLTSDALKTVEVPKDRQEAAASAPESDTASRPLLGPTAAAPSRAYAVVGVSTRGKKGPMSRRVVVPLVPPPPPPGPTTIAYDEHAITVTLPSGPAPTETARVDGEVLPSRVIGLTRPVIAFNVYDVSDPDAPIKLNAAPIADPKYTDSRIVWGAKRCYVFRAAERVGGAIIESDAAPARCKTLVDTFPPAAPKGIIAIASEGAISLIWEPNAEKDLAGYVVSRGVSPTDTLTAITPAPIQDTSFKDAVQPGLTFVYEVKAVDKAGNVSKPARVVESAR